MSLTRGSHFSGLNALPESSWMTFMVAGALLPVWSFAWFMSIAVVIDAYAFTFGGVPGTCLSFAYSMLIPAYLSMWIAGHLSKPYLTGDLPGFAAFFGFALLGTAFCELISSGSFYLWSGNFEPTLSEFMSRELKYAPAAFSSSASGAPESQSSLLNGDSVVGLDALWALGHVLELGDGSLCGLEGICK